LTPAEKEYYGALKEAKEIVHKVLEEIKTNEQLLHTKVTFPSDKQTPHELLEVVGSHWGGCMGKDDITKAIQLLNTQKPRK
jgi:hypothetical protein